MCKWPLIRACQRCVCVDVCISLATCIVFHIMLAIAVVFIPRLVNWMQLKIDTSTRANSWRTVTFYIERIPEVCNL